MGLALGRATSGQHRPHPRALGLLAVAVLVMAVLAVACAVDSSGVIRAADDDDPAVSSDDVELATGECTDLLARLQDGAVELVGPNGFIGAASQQNQFGPFFRGGFFEDFGFGVGGQAGTVSVGESAVSVGDHLAVVEGGRLYLFGDDGQVSGSVWLDALPEARFPTPQTGLLARENEVVAISPAVSLRDEAGDPYAATVIQRVDISDVGEPVIIERLSVRGEVAGTTDEGDAAHVAIAVPPPALDFLYASTAGGEDAATEYNQKLLGLTELEDWLGGYELTVNDADRGPTTTTGLLGGCDVVAAEGADAALGATVLIDLGTDGGLADLAATTVLGQGRVTFGTDAIYVLSPRSHAIGFSDPGRQGSPRVVISRIVEGDDGMSIDGIGIMAGSLSSLPTKAISDDHLMVFTNTFDNFGNGGYQAASLETVDGEIRQVDKIDLPVQPWDTLTLHAVGGELLVSGQQGSALVDVSDPVDLSVVGVEARWEGGNFVGPPQLAPYTDRAVLSIDPGPVVREFGGIDNFIANMAFGEFGFGWEPWNELQETVSVSIVEGHPLNGDVVASFEASAFALWSIASDAEAGEVITGVIGLRTEDDELFDGVLVLRQEGAQLVEIARWPLDAPAPEDFGATECEKVDIQGNLLDIMGLWNQTALRCDDGAPGGMVGHVCTALTIPEISAQDLQNWFGFDNPDAMQDLDDLRAQAAAGSAFQACQPRAAGVPRVARGLVEDTEGTGRWLVAADSVHRVGGSGAIVGSALIEPPYTS